MINCNSIQIKDNTMSKNNCHRLYKIEGAKNSLVPSPRALDLTGRTLPTVSKDDLIGAIG